MNKPRKTYPVFRLWYTWLDTTKEGLKKVKHGRYHSKRKGSFLYSLTELQELEGLINCHFTIEYAPPQKTKFKYENGNTWDFYKNESILYTDPLKALECARLFSAKSEMDEFKKEDFK